MVSKPIKTPMTMDWKRSKVFRSRVLAEDLSQSSQLAPMYQMKSKQPARFRLSWIPSSHAEVLLLAYYSFLYVPYCLFETHRALSGDDLAVGLQALFLAQTATMAIGLVLLWVIFLQHEKVLQPRGHSGITKAFSAFFIASIICRLVLERLFTAPCAPHHDCGIDVFANCQIMLIPLVLAVVFQELSAQLIWTLWCACLTAKALGDTLSHSYGDLINTFSGSILTSLVLWSLLNKRVTASLSQVAELSAEHKQVSADAQAYARHLIANVAHDLKTPVASFMAGVDGISAVLEDLSDMVLATHSAQISTTQVCETMATIQHYAKIMKNTNNFMLMTINRCIDYTKASKGLKLVPKYETIDLMDTLSLPLHCMKDIQDRVIIRLEPLSRTVCSHVITDKQWLQENILCLLSNAVKYSSSGQVIISVRLDGSQERTKIKSSFSISVQARSLFGASTSSKSNLHPALVLPADDIESAFSMMSIAMPEQDEYTNVHLRIEVEDSGIGMSDEAMAALFSPFQQNQRLAGGTGLGLFSLFQRVEALHGKCGVQRRRDGQQGSLFWFTIPYRPDFTMCADKPAFETINERESTPNKCASTDSLLTIHTIDTRQQSRKSVQTAVEGYSSPSPVSAANNGIRVLIVDDSQMIVRMTCMMLRRQGYTVITADNGAEGLKAVFDAYASSRNSSPSKLSVCSEVDILRVTDWDESPPAAVAFDVILMDLQMPIMDGLEATRRLRQWEADHNLHHFVIGVSANCEEDTMNEAKAAGFDSFISKPFNIDMFTKAMKAQTATKNPARSTV